MASTATTNVYRYNNAWTPERLAAAFNFGDESNPSAYSRALGARAQLALDTLIRNGLDPVLKPVNRLLVVHNGHAAADEHGRDKVTHALDSFGFNVMNQIANQLLLLSAMSDPDGTVPAFFFADHNQRPLDLAKGAHIGDSRITLGNTFGPNAPGWVAANAPLPDGSCNVAEAMELAMEIIAREYGLPELAQVHSLPDEADPLIIPMPAYEVDILLAGDPDDPGHVQQLLNATRYIPIRWVFVYLSNQEGFLDVYRDILGGQPNALFVELPQGARDLSDEHVFGAVSEGIGPWYNAKADEGLIPLTS